MIRILKTRRALGRHLPIIACLALVAGSAPAQTVGDDNMGVAPQTLDLPKDFTFFGKTDPNLRRPTAVINGQIITQTDVDQRLALVITANGGQVAEEEKDRLRLQVLRNLIDETLEIQEAAANDIKVDAAQIDESYARISANFRRTPAEFDAYLRAQGSSAASIRRQIEGEMAWQRLLRSKIAPFVNVAAEEVTSIMDRLNAAKGTEELHIGEIYLSASPDNAQQIFANAKNIIEQIRKGGSFQAYARQFSEASTAAVGGDLGWIRPGQIPDSMAQAAQTLDIGQLTGPVEVPGGFSIILLIDKRKVLTADPRDAILSLKQLALAFPPGTTAEQAAARAKTFGERTATIQGCGGANEIAKSVGADVVDNDGVKARDLPAALQDILLGLQVGQPTPPFGSVADGVRVLVLCGRDDPQSADAPSFDQIMSQMEDERVNKRARIYLRDLRRDAVIDYN